MCPFFCPIVSTSEGAQPGLMKLTLSALFTAAKRLWTDRLLGASWVDRIKPDTDNKVATEFNSRASSTRREARCRNGVDALHDLLPRDNIVTISPRDLDSAVASGLGPGTDLDVVGTCTVLGQTRRWNLKDKRYIRILKRISGLVGN